MLLETREYGQTPLFLSNQHATDGSVGNSASADLPLWTHFTFPDADPSPAASASSDIKKPERSSISSRAGSHGGASETKQTRVSLKVTCTVYVFVVQ